MTDSTPRRWLHRWGFPSRRGGKAPGPPRPRSRLHLEALEGRCLPSTVTNLNDSGPGSLRDAIANTPTGGTVDFQPGLSGTITLTTGKLLITTNLTIDGPGADVITVSGNHASQVFQIEATAAISGLTVADASGANHGGGIFNHNTLTLTDSVLIDNFDPYGGGGIYNTGRLTVRGSTFAGNHTTLHVGSGGGAIYNASATVVVIASLLTGNSSDAGGAIENNGGALMVSDSTLSANIAGSGAGIFNVFPAATATIDHSLLSDNQAVVSGEQNDGGAIDNDGGTLTVTDSTLSGNAAASCCGGAIDTGNGPVEIRDSTLSGNSAPYGGGMRASGGTVMVSNSTVSGNSAAT